MKQTKTRLPPTAEAYVSNRELVGYVLHATCPELDMSDDEAVFGRIIDDYADYARLLSQEQAASLQPTRPAALTDGLPHLGGASTMQTKLPKIFDIALTPH